MEPLLALCQQKVEVKGPYEGQVYFSKSMKLPTETKKINFVAGEFVNSKVGIYIKDDLSDGKL